MNDQSATLAAIREAVDGHTRRFEAVDRRFEAVDRRFDAVDRRFDAVDRRLDALDAKMSQLFMWMVGLLVTVLFGVAASVVSAVVALR